MKFKLLTKLLAISLGVSLTAIMTNLPSIAQRGRASFYCGTYKGEPATIASHPQRGEVALIVWRTNYFRQAGYDPQRRCWEVSSRFQRTHQSRILNYIVSGTTNGYPVLCASQQGPKNWIINCSSDRVLMTLRRGDNSQAMIETIYELNQGAFVSPVYHNAPILQKSPDGSMVGLNVVNMFSYSPDI